MPQGEGTSFPTATALTLGWAHPTSSRDLWRVGRGRKDARMNSQCKAPWSVSMVAFALLLLLAGCPKKVTTTVAGSDDQQMDQYTAQLEELKTRTALQCSDSCSTKTRACEVSKSVCEIAGRLADRADFQSTCTAAQEECARFNEACSACAK